MRELLLRRMRLLVLSAGSCMELEDEVPAALERTLPPSEDMVRDDPRLWSV